MKKAPAPTKTQGAFKSPSIRTNTSACSNSVKDQEQRIVAALALRSHTTDTFRALGIFQISARIWGLRAKGYVIQTDRITVVDRDGFPHPRAALYTLVSKPEGGQA
jgi:hypothetical protein